MDTIILLLMSISALSLNGIVQGFQNTMDKDELQNVWAEITQCESLIEEHTATNQNQNDAIGNLENIIRMHAVDIGHLQRTIEWRDKTQAKFEEDMERKLATLANKVNRKPDIQYDQNGVGCFMDFIEMDCVLNGTISITSAIFGKYYNTCNSDCCGPSPQDCTVHMADVDESDWLILLNKCNGQTNCSHQYTGEIINDCEPAYMADYMQIFYSCPPEIVLPLNDAIGFTARHPYSAYYPAGDILEFDDEITDVGDDYNTYNCTFVCPIRGMYVFSVSLQGQEDHGATVYIMRGEEALIEVFADGDTGNKLYPTASGVIVAECDAHQTVNIVAASTSYILGSYDAAHFTGALIQRL